MGKRQRGNRKKRDSVEEAQTLRLRKTQKEPITQGPMHVLQHRVATGEIWDLATEPRAPGQPGPYCTVPKGEHPPHLLRIFSLNLTDLLINRVKILPSQGPFFPPIILIKKLAKADAKQTAYDKLRYVAWISIPFVDKEAFWKAIQNDIMDQYCFLSPTASVVLIDF